MDEHDDIRNELQRWQVNVPVPSRFDAEVWSRIAARAGRPGGWQAWWSSLGRPAWATALAMVFIAGGVSLGWHGASAASGRDRTRHGQDYVASIDPLARPTGRSRP